MPEKIRITNKFKLFSDYWHPRVIAELNGQHVKIARLKGDFVWHAHENEDELFLVHKGVLKIEFRTETITLSEGEMLVVPRGVEHRPVAEEEVEVILFEPVGTVNTGNAESGLRRSELERL